MSSNNSICVNEYEAVERLRLLLVAANAACGELLCADDTAELHALQWLLTSWESSLAAQIPLPATLVIVNTFSSLPARERLEALLETIGHAALDVADSVTDYRIRYDCFCCSVLLERLAASVTMVADVPVIVMAR